MDPYTYRQSQFFTSVKLSNLSCDVTAESLIELFDDCGDVVSIRISKPFEGHKWAIVNFGDTLSVERAEYLSGSTFNGRIINVCGHSLTPADYEQTESFWFGRNLPTKKIERKEKKSLADTATDIADDGKNVLIDTKEKVERFFEEHKFSDATKQATSSLNEKLHLSKMFGSREKESRDYQYQTKPQVTKTRSRKETYDQHSFQDRNYHEHLKKGEIESTLPCTEKEEPNIIDMDLPVGEGVTKTEKKKEFESHATVK
ncbi:RRM domain-containing protein [Entamoeba marina]